MNCRCGCHQDFTIASCMFCEQKHEVCDGCGVVLPSVKPSRADGHFTPDDEPPVYCEACVK
jgi:hypothetical protein